MLTSEGVSLSVLKAEAEGWSVLTSEALEEGVACSQVKLL